MLHPQADRRGRQVRVGAGVNCKWLMVSVRRLQHSAKIVHSSKDSRVPFDSAHAVIVDNTDLIAKNVVL